MPTAKACPRPIRSGFDAGNPLLLKGEGISSAYVPILFLTMILSWAISLHRSVPVEGRAREASQCGSGHGPVVRPRKRHRQEAQDAGRVVGMGSRPPSSRRITPCVVVRACLS